MARMPKTTTLEVVMSPPEQWQQMTHSERVNGVARLLLQGASITQAGPAFGYTRAMASKLCRGQGTRFLDKALADALAKKYGPSPTQQIAELRERVSAAALEADRLREKNLALGIENDRLRRLCVDMLMRGNGGN